MAPALGVDNQRPLPQHAPMAGHHTETDPLRRRVRELTEVARTEDLADRGDITSELMTPDVTAEYRLVARERGVWAGCLIAGEVLELYDPRMELRWADGIEDGAVLTPGTTIARLLGPARSVLTVERVLLNFLQRLCGVATVTRAYVDAVAGTGVPIYDTRKTLPGWRQLDRYAVRCGGGRNHRMGLYDAVLAKDNHLADIPASRLAAAVSDLVARAASLQPPPEFIEIEVDTLQQLEQVFKVVGVQVVLLDNFSVDDTRAALALRESLGLAGKVQLEASGGITAETVGSVAQAGVDRIAVGAITHSAPALDLALERGAT